MKDLFKIDLQGSEGSTIKAIPVIRQHRKMLSDRSYQEFFTIEIEYRNGRTRKIELREDFEFLPEEEDFGPGSTNRWKCVATYTR